MPKCVLTVVVVRGDVSILAWFVYASQDILGGTVRCGYVHSIVLGLTLPKELMTRIIPRNVPTWVFAIELQACVRAEQVRHKLFLPFIHKWWWWGMLWIHNSWKHGEILLLLLYRPVHVSFALENVFSCTNIIILTQCYSYVRRTGFNFCSWKCPVIALCLLSILSRGMAADYCHYYMMREWESENMREWERLWESERVRVLESERVRVRENVQ